MRVSLGIPTLNAGQLLEEVLAAVDRQPGAAELERVAVDSGSTDGTLERLQAHGFEVHRIERREFNHGATRDLLISKTTGEVILLLTQDAVPANEEWLPHLVAAYEAPQVGAAYCRQNPRADCNPMIRERILEWTAARPEPVEQKLESLVAFEQMEPMERLQVCAYDNIAGSVRRTTWQEFPFGHRAFGEDVAFGKRVVLSGQSILYEPRSAVIHSHNRSPKEEGKRIYCDHANLKQLFGLHVLPTYGDYKDAVQSGRRQFAEIIEGLDLPAAERASLHAWAREYALWSARGIYLGGNADRFSKGVLGPFFRLLDRHLRKGI